MNLMAKKEEFIYMFDLTDKNFFDNIESNKRLILNHLEYLQYLKNNNELILAGTTLDDFYEMIIIKCEDKQHAEELVSLDPYVKSNFLPLKLLRYRASLVTRENIVEQEFSQSTNIDSIYKLLPRYYLGTVTPRPTFINDITEEEQKIMEEHFQFLKKLMENKMLILAGPILEEGFFGINILSTNNLVEAENMMKEDPSVKSGIMKLSLHPFRIFLFGNK